MSWTTKKHDLCTPWSPPKEIPLPEHPRPRLEGREWRNLNGLWNYAICPSQKKNTSSWIPGEAPKSWQGQILVPFAVETAASGVERPLKPEQTLWYQREFDLTDDWVKQRLMLNFEAVDWQCRCWVNGQEVGGHEGAYLPFSLDITSAVRPGKNEVVVAVQDPSDQHFQQHGKQVRQPFGCFYTATSGIWRTVWLESLPMKNHINDYRLRTDEERDVLLLDVFCSQPAPLRASLFDGHSLVAQVEGKSDDVHELAVNNPQYWSPENPHLYSLKLELLDGNEQVECVTGYGAFRRVKLGAEQHPRVHLNDQAIFLHGILDQGYWPESGMTAPSEEALIADLEACKAMGFNMLRKHIKVEDRRWYYHADRLGVAVVQDMPSTCRDNRFWLLHLGSTKGRVDDTKRLYQLQVNRGKKESRNAFEAELFEMIRVLESHPSILIWCPFNENWGQYDASRITQEIKNTDPSRLVDHASGWFDQGAGDFYSPHCYDSTKLPIPDSDEHRSYFLSEYGGKGLAVKDHVWNTKKAFIYGKSGTREEYNNALKDLFQNRVCPLMKKGLAVAVYTQISDVEIETNGLMTYDRKVTKVDLPMMQELSKELHQAFADSLQENI
ncbi:MAG: glycoside hydrolase family 2 [Spirochaetales bacterium]|nr:glycoside hydrolase family 2 [Spirochaetales bacterium]